MRLFKTGKIGRKMSTIVLPMMIQILIFVEVVKTKQRKDPLHEMKRIF